MKKNTNVTQNNNTTFLALTADTEFWDLEADKVIFLGDWCKTYDNKHIIDKLNHETMPSPWKNADEYTSARRYVNDTYTKLLPCLATFMNELHSMNEANKYWEIILSAWLRSYIALMYHRYCYIKKMIALDVDFFTSLPESNIYNPHYNTDKFIFNAVSDDTFNMTIFSLFLSKINHNIPIIRKQNKRFSNSCTKTTGNEVKSLTKKIKYMFFDAYVSFMNKISSKDIMLYLTYFPPKTIFYILRNGKRKIVCYRKNKELKSINSRVLLRNNLTIQFNHNNEFEVIIKDIISKHIPTIFIEGFSELTKFSEKSFKNSYKYIVSSVGWYNSDAFRVFAANSKSKGSKLISVQHGGYMLAESYWLSFELSLVDIFYSWGWKIDYNDVVIKNGSLSKLGRDYQLTNNRKKILFINTFTYRYNTLFRNFSLHLELYYKDQIIFIQSLNSSAFNDLVVRPYRNANNAIERYIDAIPNVKLESWDVILYDSLSETRLLVVDHLASTTACEAIAQNIPTIFFWRPIFDDFTEISKPIYEELKKVGVFHDSPESAATYINEIYNSIEDWWMESERQKAIDTFRNTFAYLREDQDKWWLNEFLNLSIETMRNS
ncbi:MAG: LIC12162 family protein [Oscillospiraceae bacterium]|jgi:putative transferase (TIGR04331 family)|nr:LIC12162 family protein [Oscillospiraceae bacterium]